MTLNIREATVEDIPALHKIRNSVTENMLRDPSKATRDDYIRFLTEIGKGWVCEADSVAAGFAIVDFSTSNVWALFVSPEFQGKGIVRKLHDTMLDWYFSNYHKSLT